MADHADSSAAGGSSPSSGIAVSTRVRLARNLAGRKFPTHPDQSERRSVLDEVRAAIMSLPGDCEFIWREMETESQLERRLLVESHMISREMADGSGPRAIAVSQSKCLVVMVNEEDHLRVQCLLPGLVVREAYDRVNLFDDLLSERLEFAFDSRYGYLTSCPTNVGTGLRVSAMLHLPALVMTRHIEKVFRAVYEMRMAVRGFYGEGTDALGELYQISNQVTCGRSEDDILGDMEAAVNAIIKYETRARSELATAEKVKLEDRVWRSWGALSHARTMSSEEAMGHLSSIRLGVAMGVMDGAGVPELERLFLYCQPAHLQQLAGQELDSGVRDVLRAKFLRGNLASGAN
ncbi:MAG: protein arginine kinase [Planctomycetota bacterium]|jgi:protein arginine kinase|nr:protein arginine kinase [Planctomycetota bacterium]